MPKATRFSLLAGAASVLAAALPASRAQADTLNWGTSGYTYSSSQTGTTATPGTAGTVATVNGNTVSIRYTMDGGNYFSTSAPNPAVGTYAAATGTGTSPIYANGGTTGSQALQILADFDNAAGNIIAGAQISVTVFFSKPVSNLIFSFYDVDNGTVNNAPYNDLVSGVLGTGGTGNTVRPISLSPGGTGFTYTSTLNATTSSFTANANNNQDAAGGNATVTFGSTPITSFTFTYGDTAAAGTAHSVLQIIALSNLSFTTVPEPSTWTCLAVAGVAGVWALRRRTRRTA